jgi:hypothetical protein
VDPVQAENLGVAAEPDRKLDSIEVEPLEEALEAAAHPGGLGALRSDRADEDFSRHARILSYRFRLLPVRAVG